MKNGFIALAAIAVLVGSRASAADMALKAPPPPPPAFSWTGFYIGANAGASLEQTDWQYIDLPSTPSATVNQSTAAGMIGGTVGFNYQFTRNIVAGLEADWDWANFNQSAPCPNPTFSCQVGMTDLGTARARLGWAWDRMLIYTTGGAAWSRVTIEGTNPAGVALLPCTPPPTTLSVGCSTTQERLGYAAGIGLEWAFWNNLSAKVEYLHFDLGAGHFNIDNPQLYFVHAEEVGNLFKLGLNYRFNWLPGPIATRY